MIERLVNGDSERIYLGKQGENMAVSIKFPVAEWISEYGAEGTFALVYRRSEDNAPVPTIIRTDTEGVTIDTKYVLWDITSFETNQAGVGRCELQYYNEGVIAKSALHETYVLGSIDIPGHEDITARFNEWMETIMGYAAEANEAALAAATSAENAEQWAGSVSSQNIVHYTEDVDKTVEEKEQACENIGAIPQGGQIDESVTTKGISYTTKVTPTMGSGWTLDAGGYYIYNRFAYVNMRVKSTKERTAGIQDNVATLALTESASPALSTYCAIRTAANIGAAGKLNIRLYDTLAKNGTVTITGFYPIASEGE